MSNLKVVILIQNDFRHSESFWFSLYYSISKNVNFSLESGKNHTKILNTTPQSKSQCRPTFTSLDSWKLCNKYLYLEMLCAC